MAVIVCISADTLNASNKLRDVVDVYDDGVVLGPAYDSFEKIHVHGMTAAAAMITK